jgi:18S rRNA (guanine1575-N7)-methyltransferase
MSYRPEHQAPPELFYNQEEAAKYANNSRIIHIQSAMTERAIQLLNINFERGPHLMLDVGCGSGLSGDILSEYGFEWMGVDISTSMLEIARQRECDGDVMLNDIGEGLPFRPGVFDGCISISVLQWLCNADFAEANPYKRSVTFFTALYACLRRGARAVFQWYPENERQMEMVTSAAMKCGFTGGMVVDYPHSTRAKKYFLVLFCGQASDPDFVAPQTQALGQNPGDEPEDEDELPSSVAVGASDNKAARRQAYGKSMRKVSVKSKEWIQNKKDRQRRQGKDVRSDSKYTGRQRKPKF